MIKAGLFHVIFTVKELVDKESYCWEEVKMEEDYYLPYRTEEWKTWLKLDKVSTHIRVVKSYIFDDLKLKPYNKIDIIDIWMK